MHKVCLSFGGHIALDSFHDAFSLDIVSRKIKEQFSQLSGHYNNYNLPSLKLPPS